MLHGIAFDLDETLSPRTQAFTAWIDAECRAAPAHTLDRARLAALDRDGYGDKEPLLAYLAACFAWPESDFAARYERFVAGCVAALTPDPALHAMLTRLAARYRLAVISNGRSRNQRAKLDKLGLTSFFAPIVISEEVGTKKPAPAIFDALLRSWGCPAETILFVGDQPKLDVLAARAVGMRALWISGGATWPLAAPAPDAIAHVLELEGALHP